MKTFWDRVLEPIGHIWHRPDKYGVTAFDGVSLHGVCKICNKDITKDSQGGWS